MICKPTVLLDSFWYAEHKGKRGRFEATRTLTHHAASLVFPPATAEYPNGAPGPVDSATLFIPRSPDGEPDYASATVTDYRRGTP